jgi:ABC-type spermidine/putrescine transport system permease subunit II
MIGRISLAVFTTLVVAFLLVPVAVVIPVSLNESRFLEFPPETLSLVWYQELADDTVWAESLWRTLIAGLVTVAIATPVGTLAALSLVRGSYPGKGLVRLLIISPLLFPLIVLAVGLYMVYSDLSILGSPQTLGVTHAVLALPFVVLVMSAAVQNLDVELESAARTLGANRWQAFWKVTFPSLRGALAVAALLSFVTSFDEVVLAIFLATGGETLPVTMFTYLQTEISPVIAAVSSLFVIAVMLAFLGAAVVRVIRPVRA